MTDENYLWVAFLPGDPNNHANKTIVVRFDEFDENLSREALLGSDPDYNGSKFPGRYLLPEYLTYNRVKYRLWGKRDDPESVRVAEPVEQSHRVGINLKAYYDKKMLISSEKMVRISIDEEGVVTEHPYEEG